MGDMPFNSASLSAVRNWNTTLELPGVLTSQPKRPQSGRVGGI